MQKDEIKEILDNLKNYANEGGEHTLMEYEIKHIQCYITNLQKNYERIYNENCKLREKHNITDISLLDENNRLKEKIKNILNKLKESAIWYDDSKDLLDYITNLQEQLHKASLDIQELTERDLMCPTSCDKITNLQEENERLKDGYCELKVKCNNGECDCTNEEYDGMVQANMKNYLLLQDYKTRNEKAIERLKFALKCKDSELQCVFEAYEIKEMIKDLQGKSDE